LDDAKNIKKLTFTKPNKGLEVRLKGSGITRKEDIEDFEFLDEKKVYF